MHWSLDSLPELTRGPGRADISHHYPRAGPLIERFYFYFIIIINKPNLRRNLCHKQKYYGSLLHGSSKCRGTLRSLAWVRGYLGIGFFINRMGNAIGLFQDRITVELVSNNISSEKYTFYLHNLQSVISSDLQFYSYQEEFIGPMSKMSGCQGRCFRTAEGTAEGCLYGQRKRQQLLAKVLVGLNPSLLFTFIHCRGGLP